MQSLHPNAYLAFFFRLWLHIAIGFCISTGAVLQAFWAMQTSLPPDIKNIVIFAVALFIPAVVVCFALAVFDARSYAFVLRDDVFYKESGIITKKFTSIPYDRIQNVDLERDIFDRVLGLSKVRIETAGSLALEGSLPGVSMRDAERLRDDLLAHAKRSRVSNR